MIDTGSIGEQIGSRGDFTAILWSDLTPDISRFYLSFYKNDEFISPDDADIVEQLFKILYRGEWMDCFGTSSCRSQHGVILFTHQGYSIHASEFIDGTSGEITIVVTKDDAIIERHDYFDRIESDGYSKIFSYCLDKTKMGEKKKELTDRLQAWANEHGYQFTEHAPNVIDSLMKQSEKHGEYYCPCRVQKIKDHVCPCIHVHDDIKKKGHCHCLLFEKKQP